jgi:hydroxypyruvate reductase
MQHSRAFDPAVITNDPERRLFLMNVLEAALSALDPDRAVRRALSRSGNELQLGTMSIDTSTVHRVIVLAMGKAAPAMAGAVADLLGDLNLEGVVVSPTAAALDSRLMVVPGDHPLPGPQSLAAGRFLMETASGAASDDLVIFLISGGGSAMAEVLPPGVDVDHLAGLNAGLLEAGAPIEEINVVRRHVSLIKGGRLAGAAGSARLLTLITSDVVGDRPEVVASGPSVADATTPIDALEIVDRYGLGSMTQIHDHLNRNAPPLPPISHEVAVVLNGAAGAEAACRAAEDQGVAARVVTSTLTGEAREVAATIVGSIRTQQSPALLAFAGETTVTVTGDGVGGRNQELALAASLLLDGETEVTVAALGTDGIDGPTDAAGAVVDGATAGRVRAAGIEPETSLSNNDAYSALEAAGELLRSGPTGTNVGDLILAYRSG